MKYIPFRKHICKILKKLLSIVEENEIEYQPEISSPERRHGIVSVIGKETGLIKKRIRVFLMTPEIEEKIKELDFN